MYLYKLFILLSLIGAADAIYLTYKHFKKQLLVCTIGERCSDVVESRWGNIFGIRNELLGIAYYVSMLLSAVGILVLPAYTELFHLLIGIGTSVGLLFSIILTLIQRYSIGAYCFYCLISAFVSLLLFIIGIAIVL